MRIEIYIEEVVVDGVGLTRRNREVLGEAVSQELAQRIRCGERPRLFETGGAAPELDAAGIYVPAGTDPKEFGRQVGRAVYGAIGYDTTVRR